ncbi:hypothetical protein GBA52_027956 [Prunus armeniaca]|nr:hypothetical protein GBA52_027956 [Prunus armeniaca]
MIRFITQRKDRPLNRKLKSPWLCELMAFHINLRETKTKSRKAPALFEDAPSKSMMGNHLSPASSLILSSLMLT